MAISAALTPLLIWLIRAAYITFGSSVAMGVVRRDGCPVIAGFNRPGRPNGADGWDAARDGKIRRQ